MNLRHIIRYYYIICALEDLRRDAYITKARLFEILTENECLTSERTLERDIADIRKYLKVSIDYSAAKGYRINTVDETPTVFHSMARFMECIVKTAKRKEFLSK